MFGGKVFFARPTTWRAHGFHSGYALFNGLRSPVCVFQCVIIGMQGSGIHEPPVRALSIDVVRPSRLLQLLSSFPLTPPVVLAGCTPTCFSNPLHPLLSFHKGRAVSKSSFLLRAGRVQHVIAGVFGGRGGSEHMSDGFLIMELWEGGSVRKSIWLAVRRTDRGFSSGD